MWGPFLESGFWRVVMSTVYDSANLYVECEAFERLSIPNLIRRNSRTGVLKSPFREACISFEGPFFVRRLPELSMLQI